MQSADEGSFSAGDHDAASRAPTAGPRRIMAYIDDAGSPGLLKRLGGSGAGLADENNRFSAWKLARLEGRERLINGAWDMPGQEFMRLAHIDNGDRIVALARDKVVVGDFGRESHPNCPVVK
jgi:hypothetical protein